MLEVTRYSHPHGGQVIGKTKYARQRNGDKITKYTSEGRKENVKYIHYEGRKMIMLRVQIAGRKEEKCT